MISKLSRTLLVLVSVAVIVSAQSAPTDASSAEEKKARMEREKKTLALVDQIIKEAEALTLPENRIRIEIALAGALWHKDEKRARELLNGAAAHLGELTSMAEGSPDEQHNLTYLSEQLRQQILLVASQHDPTLALEILRASRPAGERAVGRTSLEAQLELKVAGQIAEKDPQKALSLAQDSLRLGIDHESINFLYKLQSKDKAVAEKFLGDILNQLRTDDITRNPASYNITLILLRSWVENNRNATDRTTHPLSLSNLDEQTARELSKNLVNAALNPQSTSSTIGLVTGRFQSFRPYHGQTAEILEQLKPLLTDIERLSPNQITGLRKRIAEYDKLTQAQQGPWAKYQEMLAKGTAGELLEASKTAPPEVASSLVQQAAWKAFHQGDTNGAYEILEKIPDARQRREMALNLDRNAVHKAAGQQKITEARALISRIPSAHERANMLCQLASNASANGDKPTALQLLSEAQALAGDQAQSYSQLEAQLQIARAYKELDVSKSATIVAIAIDRINEVVAAASVLNGFDLQYFRSGEFVNNDGGMLGRMIVEFSREAGSIAANDFDRGRAMADRFQRPELRVVALLHFAERLLTTEDK